MPLKYEIVENKKLVYVIGTGAVTFYELMHHIEKLGQDSKYKAPMKKLVDYRKIKYLDLSMQEQKVLARRKAELNALYNGEKCAIVVSTDVGFGIARIHGALIDDSIIDTMVFRDVNGALSWLGVELDDNFKVLLEKKLGMNVFLETHSH